MRLANHAQSSHESSMAGMFKGAIPANEYFAEIDAAIKKARAEMIEAGCSESEADRKISAIMNRRIALSYYGSEMIMQSKCDGTPQKPVSERR